MKQSAAMRQDELGGELDAAPQFVAYRQHLERWIASFETDTTELEALSRAACALASELGRRIDDVIAALHRAGLRPIATPGIEPWQTESRRREARYAFAVKLLLSTGFGPARESAERLVLEAVDIAGRRWYAYVVIEGMRWDPEIEMRRRNWLCLETAGERRYISPVPDGWESWSAQELIAAIGRSKPDLRS